MTPTPQERTEQDALELARRVIELEGNNDPERIEVRLASALLSLAAQSEELRAELEKERTENERIRLYPDEEEIIRERDSALESRRILESRYSALVTAAKALKAHDLWLDGDHEYKQRFTEDWNVLGAILDSEASDQGGTE